MHFDVTRVATTASTNSDVAERARAGAPEGTVVVAAHQSSGRGRLDRRWEAPAGSGLAVSVLLRPVDLAPERWPWIPLMAGVAVAEVVRALGPRAGLKWPNDVEVDGAKLAGILVERVETGQGPAAVVGIGLNVAMSADQLPVPTATSLSLLGVDSTIDAVLDDVLTAVATTYGLLISDPGALRDGYLALCGTVGAEVTVHLPDGSELVGRASDVDPLGRLVVDGRPVTAGDVVRVRA